MHEVRINMEENKSSPVEPFRELILELGALVGCSGHFSPSITFTPGSITIEGSGPDGSFKCQFIQNEKDEGDKSV
jgi:hypothetical protein